MWRNLPRHNQTTAEQPDSPPDSSVNLQTGKSLHFHGNGMIRNTHTHTHTSWGNVKTVKVILYLHGKESTRSEQGLSLRIKEPKKKSPNSNNQNIHIEHMLYTSYRGSIQGMTLGSLCTQQPLCAREGDRDGSAPPLALIDSTRLTRRARSKGSQEKNKHVPSPSLSLSHAPALLTANFAIWDKGDPKLGSSAIAHAPALLTDIF